MPCPSEEQLASYLYKGLAPHEAEIIRAHIDDCQRCKKWLDGARADEKLVPYVRRAFQSSSDDAAAIANGSTESRDHPVAAGLDDEGTDDLAIGPCVGGDATATEGDPADLQKREEDRRFSEVLVDCGIVSQQLVEDALAEQKSRLAQGQFERICDLLMRRNAITQQQAEATFEAIGKHYRFCPQCGQRLNVRNPYPGKGVKCTRCHHAFAVQLLSPPTNSQAAREIPVAEASAESFDLDAAGAPARQRRKTARRHGRRAWDDLAEIGQYKIGGVLGAGAMGQVYRGLHRFTERVVAVKVLKPTGSSLESDRTERFLREIKLADKLEHPNIVRVLDAGEEGGLYYLVMEYVQGIDLESRLERDGPLGWEFGADVLCQVA
ncbi:MAG: protein kinase domain-containing protein, partial [Planctomycetota bacterium]